MTTHDIMTDITPEDRDTLREMYPPPPPSRELILDQLGGALASLKLVAIELKKASPPYRDDVGYIEQFFQGATRQLKAAYFEYERLYGRRVS